MIDSQALNIIHSGYCHKLSVTYKNILVNLIQCYVKVSFIFVQQWENLLRKKIVLHAVLLNNIISVKMCLLS